MRLAIGLMACVLLMGVVGAAEDRHYFYFEAEAADRSSAGRHLGKTPLPEGIQAAPSEFAIADSSARPAATIDHDWASSCSDRRYLR